MKMDLKWRLGLWLWLCLCLNGMALSFGRDSREKRQEYTDSLRSFLVTIDRSLSEVQTQKLSPATVTHLLAQYRELSPKASPQKKLELESALAKLSTPSSSADSDRQIRSLRTLVIEAFRVVTAPAQTPNFQAGAGLYQEYCAACHGSSGQGDGKLAQNKRYPMVPPPTQLQSLAASGTRTAFSIYNMLLVGIAGSMEPFDVLLKDEERWHLAFYLMAQPFLTGSGPTGEAKAIWSQLTPPEKNVLRALGGSLGKIANLTDIEIEAKLLEKMPQLSRERRQTLVLSLRRGLSFLPETPRG